MTTTMAAPVHGRERQIPVKSVDLWQPLERIVQRVLETLYDVDRLKERREGEAKTAGGYDRPSHVQNDANHRHHS